MHKIESKTIEKREDSIEVEVQVRTKLYKSILKYICLGFIALIVLMVYPIIRDVYLHNKKLSDLEDSFNTLKHPSGSTFVDNFSRVGLFLGNGNHTDYAVIEVRSFTGDYDNVVQFYATQEIDTPFGFKSTVDIDNVEKIIEEGYNPLRYYGFGIFDLQTMLQKHKKLYLIKIMNSEEAGWDPRSH